MGSSHIEKNSLRIEPATYHGGGDKLILTDIIIIVNILWFGNLLSSRASIQILDALGDWPVIIFIKMQPAAGALMAIFELKL